MAPDHLYMFFQHCKRGGDRLCGAASIIHGNSVRELRGASPAALEPLNLNRAGARLRASPSYRVRLPHGKEDYRLYQAAGARGRCEPVAPDRPCAGSARRQHHGILQGVQRADRRC